MGKMKVKLLPDGTIEMVTEGIKGKKCADYAKVFQRLTDAKVYSIETTKEYYEQETIKLDEREHLKDN